MKNTPLANIWFAKNDGVKIQVTNVDFFRPKETHKAIILLEEWAFQILDPDVPHVLKEALNNSEKNERYKKSNTSPGGAFKITNKNFTKKAQANYNNQNEDCNTTTEQNNKKSNAELAKTINSALEDLLKKAQKKSGQ